MPKKKPLVCVVDDDESVRESLPDLLRELGFSAETFPSAEDFLGCTSLRDAKCLILDIAMPGMTGPELQQELMRRGEKLPLIFITAQIDEAIRQNVLKRGAVACLYKPFTEATLMNALDAAVDRTDK